MGQKRAKFCAISDDFKVRRHIFSERKKMFEIGQIFYTRISFALGEKSSVNLGLLITEIYS